MENIYIYVPDPLPTTMCAFTIHPLTLKNTLAMLKNNISIDILRYYIPFLIRKLGIFVTIAILEI